MKSFEITSAAVDLARAAARQGGIRGTNCVVAQAATPKLEGAVVTDCGSFYVDTDKGSFEFVGGYTGEQAKKVRNVIDLFRSGKDEELKKSLPLVVVLK